MLYIFIQKKMSDRDEGSSTIHTAPVLVLASSATQVIMLIVHSQ